MPFEVFGQDIPKVGTSYEIAGIRIKLTARAREDIQKEVFNIRKSPKYFNILADRAALYFPIISRVLKEQNVPDDFKYLAVQESKLVSDAVSSAKAVGFWQFKYATGREVGLRIDRTVDERLNVAASTEGAARYFKKSNFKFRNWIYAVLAHYTGASGADKYVKKEYIGASKMTIDHNMFWYVKRFIAHKIAYEGAVPAQSSGGLRLVEHFKGGGQTLSQISRKYNIDYELLSRYNKWLKSGSVPTDRAYAVILPSYRKIRGAKGEGISEPVTPKGEIGAKKPPVAKSISSDVPLPSIFLKLNRIDGILARRNETIAGIASRSGIEVKKFMKLNDMSMEDKVLAGEVYYLKSKKGRARIYFHRVKPGETFWAIAQRYGVKLRSLKKLNRIGNKEAVEPKQAETVWLREFRSSKDVLVTVTTAAKRLEKGKSAPKAPVPKAKPKPKAVKKPVEKAPEPTAPIRDPNVKYKIHTVQKGESLWGIANRNDIHVDELIACNELSANLILQVGDQIYIPQKKKKELKEDKKPIKPKVVKPEEPQPKPTPDPKGRKHTVKAGESLWAISQKYERNVEAILKHNDLNSNVLQPGQVIYIPRAKDIVKEPEDEEDNRDNKPNIRSKKEPNKVVATTLTHTVKNGDTLYAIARKYNITVQEVMALNDKKDHALKIGETLRVSK